MAEIRNERLNGNAAGPAPGRLAVRGAL